MVVSLRLVPSGVMPAGTSEVEGQGVGSRPTPEPQGEAVSGSQLSTVQDHHLGAWFAAAATAGLDSLQDFQSFTQFTEDHVFSIQPRGDCRGDEELGAIGVGAGVRHAQQTSLEVLELEVFILKLCAVNGFSTGAIAGGEVATLTHEIRNNPMEC